jgi:hypothetical protein
MTNAKKLAKAIIMNCEIVFNNMNYAYVKKSCVDHYMCNMDTIPNMYSHAGGRFDYWIGERKNAAIIYVTEEDVVSVLPQYKGLKDVIVLQRSACNNPEVKTQNCVAFFRDVESFDQLTEICERFLHWANKLMGFAVEVEVEKIVEVEKVVEIEKIVAVDNPYWVQRAKSAEGRLKKLKKLI